jgi:hypothetical protein
MIVRTRSYTPARVLIFYLTDRFILRVEYKRHTVLTSRDDNEEIDQWKAGFSVFF